MGDILEVLDQRLRTVCPIEGISLGDRRDKTTWRIDFAPEATRTQRQASQDVITNFDVALEEQKSEDADKAKIDKKASLLLQPNKSVTVQDLLDLGLL